MPAPLLFVVLAFAAHRLTRAVAVDSITDPARNWLHRRTSRAGAWVADLIACSHCIGWWVSGVVVGTTWLAEGLPLPWLWWFGVAGVQSVLASVDARLSGAP